jgi:hypothetical protein
MSLSRFSAFEFTESGSAGREVGRGRLAPSSPVDHPSDRPAAPADSRLKKDKEDRGFESRQSLYFILINFDFVVKSLPT